MTIELILASLHGDARFTFLSMVILPCSYVIMPFLSKTMDAK